MPRSMQDILDHADELAKTFEDYEPSPDDEVEIAEYLLPWSVRGASDRSPTPFRRPDALASPGSGSAPRSAFRRKALSSDTDRSPSRLDAPLANDTAAIPTTLCTRVASS